MPPKDDPHAAPAPAPAPAQFTPAQMRDVLSKTTAATNAATTAMREAITSLPELIAAAIARQQPAAVANAAADPAVPAHPFSRDLRDRRVPDFWEHNPRAWFVIHDDHFATAAAATPLTQSKKFKHLLPLLTQPAVVKLNRFITNLPDTVYDLSKAALILHFERPREEMIAELHGLSALDGRTAVDFLEHMRSLQAGDAEHGLFRHIFVKSLPKYVSAIVSSHDSLDEMAAAADVVLWTVPRESAATLPATSPTEDFSISAVQRQSSSAPAQHRSQLSDGLCFIHQRWGRDAYHCALPDTCRMKDIVRPRRNQDRRQFSGNANVGRR